MSFEHIEQFMCGISREEFIRLMQKNITHSQWLELRESERYLLKMFESVDTRELTENEKRKIASIIKQQNQDIWDLLFAGCLGDAIEAYPGLTPEQRHKYAWNRAENLMLAEMYSPPHFTKSGYCNSCGPILLPESAIETELNVCPWCAVGFLSKFNNGEKKYEQ